VAFLALKNGFSERKKFPPQKKFFFLPLLYATFQCGLYGVFKKNLTFFLTPKKRKNGPQELLIIGPTPFFPQSSPDHSPQPRIDFSYYEISGPDICSLICGFRPFCYYTI